jgi:hypothetical protein
VVIAEKSRRIAGGAQDVRTKFGKYLTEVIVDELDSALVAALQADGRLP